MSRLWRSFGYAGRGLSYAFLNVANMRIHLLAASAALLAGWWLQITTQEWVIISLTIFLVLALETINTAVETTVDLITRQSDPLAGRAKDLAAGAVLLAAVNAIVVAGLILLPKILALI